MLLWIRLNDDNEKYDVIVNKKNGLVSNSVDAYTVSYGLFFYIKYENKRRNMTEQGSKKMRHYFGVKSMISSYSHLYEELILK